MEGFDTDARYSVDGHGGIAFYVVGWDTETTEETWTFIGGPDDDTDDEENYVYDEPEEIENRERVRAIMVGDDREWTFDVEDLTPISEDDYCPECGQIGCKAYA